MKPIGDALDEILPAFEPLARQRLSLLEAQGLFLAEDLAARFDLPPFDNSAMDGYAVRIADVGGASEDAPVSLPVVGESRAGGELPGAHRPGTAMRIFTGAPLPLGADAVVMQEDTEREGEEVRVRLQPREAWRHVRRRGGDLRAGEVMLHAGARLGPGELGLLASQNHAAVTVWRRPRVALLSTGDELRDASDPPSPGTIVNSNAYALAAQVQAAGGVPWILPIAADRPQSILAAVREGLQADVLVSIGGVSVGDYDLVNAAFAEAGVEQRFWKIAMKPGKPVSFGVAGDVPVLGLPGNPVSAMVTFEVFVRPGLRRMLGDPRPHRRAIQVRLAHPHSHSTGRTELARARLSREGAEGWVADLRRQQGSGALTSMVDVEALVILPASQESFPAGVTLQALWLDGDPGVADSPFGDAGTPR